MLRHKLSALLLYLAVGALSARAATQQFLEAPQYATGNNPQAVATGDFNGDGNLDLAVLNSTSNTVSILLGNGDGTFKTQVTYATGHTPQGIAVGDFNGDGSLDLAITNSAGSTGFCSTVCGSVSILLGNGDGTFKAKTDYATGNKPIGIAVGYFNGSSNPLDLVVTNAQDGTLGVLQGNGNGTFKAQVTYNTGFNPWSVAVGDVNGDGILDLVVANNNDNNVVSVLLGNSNGTFQNQQQSGTGNTPVWVALADFNGDGKIDLAVADQKGNTVSILLGNGNGSFAAHVEYPTAPFPTAVAVGDFNGDGKLDLAVSAGNGNTVSILWGNGNGTFQGQENCGTGDIPYSVIAADFNNDGKTDLAVANSGANSVSVILNDGNENFQSRSDYPAGGTQPYSVAVGDFNGDGVQDLAVAISDCEVLSSCGPGSISILMGNGDGTFQAPTQYSTGTNTDPDAVVAADFNGDGILDLAVSNYATNSVSILLGEGSNGVGNGTFAAASPAYTFAVGNEPSALATGDFNGDGIPDLAVTNYHSNTLSVLLGNGDGTFKTAVSYPTGNGPISIAVGNFGNGYLDLAVVNESDNDVGVLLNNGNGTFQSQVTYSTGNGGNPLSVVAGDFSGNGILDLAIADFHSQQASILMGNGNGTFQAVKQYSTGQANPSSVVTADFNGDGKLDLAFTSQPVPPYPGNEVSLLLGNGDGTFQAPYLFGTGSFSYSAAVGDFNNDGAADLAIANGISNTVSVLLNAQGTQITVTPSPNPSTYGQSVTFTTSVAASMLEAVSPTGTVTLTFGNSTLGSGTLANGTVTITTSSLPTGADTISAAYSGDSNFQAHTVSVIQAVNQAGTTTSLASSVNPSSEGQSVTFTATVKSSTGTPTGSVNFLNGTTSLGSSALNGSGVATLTTSSLSLGTHSITASYGGNTNFAASTSSVLNQSVVQGSTSVVLASTPNPSTFTQSVGLTATVSSSSPGTPTGTVTFTSGTTALGTSPLSASGTATLAIGTLSVGTDSVIATYSGDSNFNAATSSPMTQTVQPASTSTTLSASSNSPSLTLTATVASGAGTPTGTVTFMDGTTTLGSASVNGGGVAVLSSLNTLTAGGNSITASYSGGSNTNFAGSISSGVPVAVNFSLTDAALTPGSISPGASATATVTITPSNGFNTSLVTLSCAITPATNPAPTCTVGQVANGQASVTVATTPNSRAMAAGFTDRRPGALLAFALLVPAMLLGAGSLSKHHKQQLLAYAFAALVVGGCMFQAACGGNGSANNNPPTASGGTPAGNYTVTVTGSSNGVQNSAPALTLTVQ